MHRFSGLTISKSSVNPDLLVPSCEWRGSMVDQIFVQEWVDFEVEMRHFFVEVDLHAPWKQVEFSAQGCMTYKVTKRRGEPGLK